MAQQYSLKWNNHQPNFISMFTTFLNEPSLDDVVLSAEDGQVQAHRLVLSACSTYFQTLFEKNPSPNLVVVLKDVLYSDLRIVVDFMYSGEVNITEEQLPRVIETAKGLKIKGLTEMQESAFINSPQTPVVFQSPGDSGSQTHSSSPVASPLNKRNKRRKNTTGSTSLNILTDPTRNEDAGQSADLVQGDSVTISSLSQQRRIRDQQQAQHEANQHNFVGMESMESNAMGNSQAVYQLPTRRRLQNRLSLSPGGQWSMVVDHTYPRYSNACIVGGSFQQDHGISFINNVINPYVGSDLNDYGQGLEATGPSPGSSCIAESQTTQEAVPQTQTKRRRTTNPQSEENFQRAIEAVRFGGIGFCKAARLYGVNNRTLWLEYKKKGYPNNRQSIRNRIKREHISPSPKPKEEIPQSEQHVSIICPPHPVPVSFIDSRPIDFPMQGVPHNSPLNILGMNFTMQ